MKMKTSHVLLALAAAFTAFASATPAPATAMLEAMKVAAAADSFASDIELAGGEALRRNARVVMCQSHDGASCANAGSWSQGWIVFEDANGDGMRGTQEQLILRVPALSRSLRLAGSMDSVRAFYFGTGGVQLAGAITGAATLTICSNAGQPTQARQLTLQRGRLLHAQVDPANGCV